MFHTILFCTDGSEDALHAARLTAEIALPLQADVVVLNALDIAAMTAPYAAAPESLSCTQVILDYAEEGQHDIVARTTALLKEAGLTCRTRCETGHPSSTIVEIADAEKADLIILGSHGLSGLKKMLLGSVSDGVARYAHCPVLIVRGQTEKIITMLLASDGSVDSDKATLAAAELARALSARLTVLHVLEAGKPSLGIPIKDVAPEAYAARVQQELKQRVDQLLEGADINYAVCLQQGHPADTVTQFAAAHAIDLIVVGSRGLGGFQRLLMGSVSDAVMHHAGCPVLIVR